MPSTKSIRNFDEEHDLLNRFAHEHRGISYDEFDRAVLEDINLFLVPKDEAFFNLEITLDKIIESLPSIKRIFSKPITRLSDTNNVLSVEAARVINNQSMVYLSQHSETWGDIKNGGELHPKKLMTLERVEDYATYENIIFVRLVDFILSYVRRSFRMLKDIMYANRDLSFNLLESTNHANYFLALGKLHIGYIRGRNIDNVAYDRCLDKLLLIDKTIRSKLNSHVYISCRKKKTINVLKRTNVFRVQKDYKQIYSLVKWFGDGSDTNELHWMTQDSSEVYPEYCNMLTVFALGHINFKFVGNSLDFIDMKATACFHNWQVELKSVCENRIKGLIMSFSKERTYRIAYIFGSNEQLDATELAIFKKAYKAEEYWFISSTKYGVKETIYLSLFDIDSFRRIQQLAIRGMIYSDETHDTCPFCGYEMTKDEGGCHCKKCRTNIVEQVCEESGEKYYVSKIYEYKPKRQVGITNKDKFLLEKITESQLFFRNITNLTMSGESICPKCGKIHK